MLETLLKDNVAGNYVLDLHPSTQRFFSDGGKVEEAFLSGHRNYRQFIEDRFLDGKEDDEDRSVKEAVKEESIRLLRGTGSVVGIAGYIGTELVCRLSESAVRGTGRLTNYGYHKAAQKWEGVKNFGEKVKSHYENFRRKVPQSIKNFFGRFKDPLVIGASVAAMAFPTCALMSDDPEEKVSQDVAVEMAYDPQDVIDNLFVEVEEEAPVVQREERVQRQPERTVSVSTLALNRFDNDRVLVYCANGREKDYVLTTLEQNNNGVRSIYFHDGEKEATLINAHNREIEVDIVVEGEPIPRRNYEIVALRGHTQDMMPLYHNVVEHEAENSIYLLGGCQSARFINRIAQPNRAVFGVREGISGQGPINTYALLRVIDEMDNGSSTWEEMNSSLRRNSTRINNEFVLPETRGYNSMLRR